MLKNGIIFVRFDTVEAKNEVLQGKYDHSEDECRKKKAPMQRQRPEKQVAPLEVISEVVLIAYGVEVDSQETQVQEKQKHAKTHQGEMQQQWQNKERTITAWITPNKLGKISGRQQTQVVSKNTYQVLQKPNTDRATITMRKLKLLKNDLKALNSQYFRNIVTESNDDREILSRAQRTLPSNPMNLALQHDEKIKFVKFKRSSFLAEMFLQ
ncbi:hypothetical protein H5410_053089 [Solanum commersonii]|uniref:Uncharacterized protein n=1 Tax=Solanum commersonii TaxID=4109 RepID=A0A9J5X5F1_SOLCO|nr:hypothetical protein H5410_053089 [Solanum commersonii]